MRPGGVNWDVSGSFTIDETLSLIDFGLAIAWLSNEVFENELLVTWF